MLVIKERKENSMFYSNPQKTIYQMRNLNKYDSRLLICNVYPNHANCIFINFELLH
jgi:hypothetical protein